MCTQFIIVTYSFFIVIKITFITIFFCLRSVESEVEDGPKEDESDETNSQRAESQNSDRPESRRNINKKTEVVKHPKKAGVIKNVADIEALELATEQTLKVV